MLWSGTYKVHSLQIFRTVKFRTLNFGQNNEYYRQFDKISPAKKILNFLSFSSNFGNNTQIGSNYCKKMDWLSSFFEKKYTKITFN